MEREDAAWTCCKVSGGLEIDVNRPCKDHLCLPGLFAFASVHSYVESLGIILMENSDGKIWHHGNDTNSYCTMDLLTLPADLLTHDSVSYVKLNFGGKMKFVQDPMQKYPVGDSRVVWKGPAAGLTEAWLTFYKTDLGTRTPVERFENHPEYDAAEIIENENGVLVILWGNGTAEIREGVQ